MKKRVLAAVLAILLLTGQVGFAEETEYMKNEAIEEIVSADETDEVAVSADEAVGEAVYMGDSNIYNSLRNISFNDVAYKPVDHWSANAIYFMAAIGAIKGYDGNFDMTSPVKNHEAMAVLFRCAGLEEEAEELRYSVLNFKQSNPGVYNDLDSWADGYMRLAVENKLITPVEFLSTMEIEYMTNPQPLFRKDGNAIRAELAKWMVIVLGLEMPTKENLIIDFYDYSSIKEDDKLYLETAVKYGILKGADGYLNPYSTLTREEMAQMFYNVYTCWAEKGGFEVVTDTVSDITVDTVKNSDGTKLNNVKTIIVGNKALQTRITYNLNGEVVDQTIYPYNEYVDFPVIRDKQIPVDSSSLNIGEMITVFLKGNKVVCAFESRMAEEEIALDTSLYDTSEVCKGKLYYYDKDDRTVVIENENGEYVEIPLFPGAEIFKREKLVEQDDVNVLFADSDVYVFTVRKNGTQTDRGYRIQIL